MMCSQFQICYFKFEVNSLIQGSLNLHNIGLAEFISLILMSFIRLVINKLKRILGLGPHYEAFCRSLKKYIY